MPLCVLTFPLLPLDDCEEIEAVALRSSPPKVRATLGASSFIYELFSIRYLNSSSRKGRRFLASREDTSYAKLCTTCYLAWVIKSRFSVDSSSVEC